MSSEDQWGQGYRHCLDFRSSFKVADYLSNSFLVTERTKKDLVEGLTYIVDPIRNLGRFRKERLNISAAEYAVYTSYHVSSFEEFEEDLNRLSQYNYGRHTEIVKTLVALHKIILRCRKERVREDERLIAFSDFLTAGDLESSIIVAGLRANQIPFRIVMPKEAKTIIYNVYTSFHRLYGNDVSRVYWTNEMDSTDTSYAHVSMCPANCFDQGRHMWYPGWLSCVKLQEGQGSYYGKKFSELDISSIDRLSERREIERQSDVSSKADISVLLSNGRQERLTLVRMLEDAGLSMLKGGRCFGTQVEDKVAFIKGAIINMCFENTTKPGYMTEKIIDSYTSQCIPLYWSIGINTELLNQGAYLEMNTYRRPDELAERIKKLTKEEIIEMKSAPLFTRRYDVKAAVARAGRLIGEVS